MTEKLNAIVDETITRCAYGDGKRGTEVLRFDSQGGIVVCKPHEKLLKAQNKKVRCQYCGVPIKDNWRKSALDGFHHQAGCSRSDVDVIEVD